MAKAKGSLVPLPPELVERAMRHILTSTLALYVLSSSKRPLSQVARELMDMECKAGHLVGMILQLQAQNMRPVDLEGTLAGVLSFVPLAGASQLLALNKDGIDGRMDGGENQNRRRARRSRTPAIIAAQKKVGRKAAQRRRP